MAQPVIGDGRLEDVVRSSSQRVRLERGDRYAGASLARENLRVAYGPRELCEPEVSSQGCRAIDSGLRDVALADVACGVNVCSINLSRWLWIGSGGGQVECFQKVIDNTLRVHVESLLGEVDAVAFPERVFV